jgi:hypothetical protein
VLTLVACNNFPPFAFDWMDLEMAVCPVLSPGGFVMRVTAEGETFNPNEGWD